MPFHFCDDDVLYLLPISRILPIVKVKISANHDELWTFIVCLLTAKSRTRSSGALRRRPKLNGISALVMDD
jgi:hypothetical protein